MLAGVFFGTAGAASVLFQVLTPSFSLWALKFNRQCSTEHVAVDAYFFLKSPQTRGIGQHERDSGGTRCSPSTLAHSLRLAFVVAAAPGSAQIFALRHRSISIAVGLLGGAACVVDGCIRFSDHRLLPPPRPSRRLSKPVPPPSGR
jgi:hypothetical protein